MKYPREVILSTDNKDANDPKELESSQMLEPALRTSVSGDSDSEVHDWFTRLYNELRTLASSYVRRESATGTFQTTALVHEAYLRLAGQSSVGWSDRRGFFAASATVMRRILVDHARTKKAQKRGGQHKQHPLDSVLAEFEEHAFNLIELNDALNKLAELDARKARVAELRFFVGLSVDETAEILGVSSRTVAREWILARTWLLGEMKIEINENEELGRAT